MTFARFLSAVVLSFALFVPKVEASTINLHTVDADTYATTTTLKSGKFSLLNPKEIDYLLKGTLAANTTLTLTLTALDATSVAPKSYIDSAYSLGGGATVDLGRDYASSTKELLSTIVLSNTSSDSLGFVATLTGKLWSVLNLVKGSYVLTATTVSNVPLPPALLLFGSGLVAFAGFGRRKKA